MLKSKLGFALVSALLLMTVACEEFFAYTETISRVYIWGQPGDPLSTTDGKVREIEGLKVEIKQISIGLGHALILTAGGKLYAIGDNDYGQLGNGSLTDSNTPRQVSLGNRTVVAFSAGEKHSAAVTSSNGTYTLWTWGANHEKQLGRNPELHHDSTPQRVEIKVNDVVIEPDSMVAAGGAHTLVAGKNKEIYGFGANNYGQLGNDTYNSGPTPTRVIRPADKVVKGLAAGFYHSGAIFSDGSVYSWGDNTHYQLGNRRVGFNQKRPVAVVTTAGDLTGVDCIAANGNSMVAWKIDGGAYGWGSLYKEQGDIAGVANAVMNLTMVKSISVGLNHAVALGCGLNGKGVCVWGKGNLLGDGIDKTTIIPQELSTVNAALSDKATGVAAGGTYTIVLTEEVTGGGVGVHN